MRSSTWGRIATAATIAFSIALADPALAQEQGKKKRVLEVGKWYPGIVAGVNLTQSSYSDNWNGGDRGSIVWTAILTGTLERQVERRLNWSNVLKLAYGQTHRQEVDATGERGWDHPDKSTDLIDYETIARVTLGGFVDPFLAGRFESQFQDASDAAGRNLTLNPLRFKETAGIAREIIAEKDQTLLSRFGFSFRQSARRQFVNPFPDTATETETTNDGGLEWTTDYKAKVLEKRVTWTSKLSVYQPLFFSGKDALDGLTPQQIAAASIDHDIADFTTTLDADWENIFSTQITKLISVNLYTRWIYDKYDNSVLPVLNDAGDLRNAAAVRSAVRKSGQFKQTLSVGLTYRFL